VQSCISSSISECQLQGSIVLPACGDVPRRLLSPIDRLRRYIVRNIGLCCRRQVTTSDAEATANKFTRLYSTVVDLLFRANTDRRRPFEPRRKSKSCIYRRPLHQRFPRPSRGRVPECCDHIVKRGSLIRRPKSDIGRPSIGPCRVDAGRQTGHLPILKTSSLPRNITKSNKTTTRMQGRLGQHRAVGGSNIDRFGSLHANVRFRDESQLALYRISRTERRYSGYGRRFHDQHRGIVPANNRWFARHRFPAANYRRTSEFKNQIIQSSDESILLTKSYGQTFITHHRSPIAAASSSSRRSRVPSPDPPISTIASNESQTTDRVECNV